MYKLFALLLIITATTVHAESAVYVDIPSSTYARIFEVLTSSNDKTFMHCLSVDNKPVPSEVIDELQAKKRKVAQISDCTWVSDRAGGYHTASRDPAMFVDVTNFKEISPTDATAIAFSFRHGLYGTKTKIILKRATHGWDIFSMQIMSVSSD